MHAYICDGCGRIVLPHKNLGVQQIDDLDFCLACFNKYSSKINLKNHTFGSTQIGYIDEIKNHRLNQLKKEAGLLEENLNEDPN